MKHSIVKTLAALAALVLTALPLSAAEVVTYYHNDHLGSPIAATDDTGTVVWQQAYDLWGVKVTTNTDERGYTGNWLDEETGLADHKARWYTSSIGRFTGIDPVKWQESNIHSFNRYAYASNNPYAYVDRDGRNAVTFLGGLAVESYNALSGNGFNGSRVLGALADGYNGEGAGFARSLYQDAESFVPIGAVAGALIKSGRLAKAAVTKGTPKSLKDQAADLIPQNANKNRVTLRSPSQKLEVDLAGRTHGDVPTPHTKVSPRNLKAPNQPAYNTKNSPVRPATQQDIRTVRRYLGRQGQQ